jgi:hypothetical protein
MSVIKAAMEDINNASWLPNIHGGR